MNCPSFLGLENPVMEGISHMGAGYQRVTKCMHGTMAAPDKGKKTRYVRENRLAHDGESPVHFVRGTDRHAIHYIKTPNPLYNARPRSQSCPSFLTPHTPSGWPRSCRASPSMESQWPRSALESSWRSSGPTWTDAVRGPKPLPKAAASCPCVPSKSCTPPGAW